SGTMPRNPRHSKDPKLRAVELCREASGGMESECKLYSVDNEIVYGKPAASAEAPAPAPRPPVRTRFAANLVVDHQFNAVGTVTFADGSTSDLGDAMVGLNAGAAFPLSSDGKYEIQGLIGFLYSKINASNGSATFWDFPLEVTAHVNLGSFRIGAGPSLH